MLADDAQMLNLALYIDEQMVRWSDGLDVQWHIQMLECKVLSWILDGSADIC